MPCYTYNLKALISFKMAYSLSYNQKWNFPDSLQTIIILATGQMWTWKTDGFFAVRAK